MLRLIHTADVHLGARHTDLGEQASAQRERQFAAFRATVDLALSERVDLFLIAGDLFDSNTQPRRSVERVAVELKRLVDAHIRTVIIPGTHDVYDRASIYRAYDLPALVEAPPDGDLLTVLTPDRSSVELPTIGAVVHGVVFATKRAPHSPLRDLKVKAPPAPAGGSAVRAADTAPDEAPADAPADEAEPDAGDDTAAADTAGAWQIGLVHGSLAIPGSTDNDEVVITTEEIAASKLDYLALGHWHSAQKGKAGSTSWAYSGAPEPVAVDQDGAGSVMLVQLDTAGARTKVTIDERRVGRTLFEKLDVDAATLASQAALEEQLAARANPDLVLSVRLIGVRPDELDVDVDEVETRLRESFMRLRVRDRSLPALTAGMLPPPDTISGAFIRDVEAQITQLEAADHADEAAELRDVLRIGRLLLEGHEVTL